MAKAAGTLHMEPRQTADERVKEVEGKSTDRSEYMEACHAGQNPYEPAKLPSPAGITGEEERGKGWEVVMQDDAVGNGEMARVVPLANLYVRRPTHVFNQMQW